MNGNELTYSDQVQHPAHFIALFAWGVGDSKMIKVNERFRFERYAYGWKLIETVAGENKKKEQTLTDKESFYSSVAQCCNQVIERSIDDGTPKGISETALAVERTKNEIVAAIKEAGLG